MLLHPAISHAPPLLITLTLISEALAYFFNTERWRAYATTSLLFAAVFTPLSYLTGYLAAEQADQSFQVANQVILEHQASAKLLLFALFATLCLRAGEHYAEKKQIFRLSYFALLLLSTLIALNTGYRGGELVYQHGAGVSASQP